MKICFVAHFAYGALTNDPSGHIGGVERQTALMSKWLAAQGHEVSVVTLAEGSATDEVIDGVTVLKTYAPDQGLPGLRFFHPRWSALVQALRRADADIYYQNCAESATGQVALWAKRAGRKFVFSVASDPECDPALPVCSSFWERWLYTYGLNHADEIFVQTRVQQRMLAEGFGLESSVQKMPCRVEAESDTDRSLALRSPQPRVLWLGRFAPVKNLQRLYDVAQLLPDVQFDVVGGEDKDPGYAREMTALGESFGNVVLHGRLQPQQVEPLLRRCWMLLCTSDYEGFPNTFLEAWAHARPVVSTVDPDDVLSEQSIGIFADDAQSLAAAIRSYCCDAQVLRKAAEGAHAYFKDHHAIDRAMQRFERQFEAVAGAEA